MEFLGTITDRPKMRKRGHFKWEYINLMYESDSLYNEASGKIVKILNSDGKALIKDTDGKNYIAEIIHSNFDHEELSIRLLPFDIKSVQA
jgi:hypothetical protein